jgi:spermidine synthase
MRTHDESAGGPGSRAPRPAAILPPMSPLAAAALVFTSSGAVLALEILAGRLLAPYVGVTLESYTGIIGVILAGIAGGSWIGGRMADRHDPHALLGPLLTFGGATALLTIPVVDYLGQSMRGARPSTVVIMALCGFVLPAAILSAVTPVVVKIQLDDLHETGRIVGRLSAVGTFGALFGTFVTGFVLIAALPTRPVIRGIGFALIVLGVAVWLWMHRRSGEVGRPGVGALSVAVVAGLLSFGQSDPCEYESAYFCAFVTEDPDRAGGRTLWLDTLRHSYIDVDDPSHLEFSYARTMGDVLAEVAPHGEPLDVVHVGGGGLSLPRYLEATRPGTSSTVLEIDPLLTTIAKQELGYEPIDSIDVVNGDARLNIEQVPDAHADLVIGDAFGGVSVPWHLTTREFLVEVRDRLEPGGWYALNLIDYPPLGFARAEAVTLEEVFGHVAVFAPPERLAGESGGNFVVVASTEPLPTGEILERNAQRGDDEAAVDSDGFASSEGRSWSDFVGGAEVLTDDHAPVDQLLNPYPTG